MVSVLSMHAVLGDGKEELAGVTQEMRSHLKKEQELDDAEWAKLRGELTKSIQENDKCVKESTEDAAEFREQIASSQKTQATSRGVISGLELRSSELSETLEKHEKRGVRDAASFKKRQFDDKAAIEACNQAIALLKTYPGVSDKALFLQTKLKEPTILISTYAMKQGSVYATLIEGLAELAEMKKSDTGTVESVIGLIKQLRESIRKARNMGKMDYRKKLASWTKTRAGLIKSIAKTKEDLTEEKGKLARESSFESTAQEGLKQETREIRSCGAAAAAQGKTRGAESNGYAERTKVRYISLILL